jgi:hypothetical protein
MRKASLILVWVFVALMLSSPISAMAETIHLDLSGAQIEFHPPERFRLRQVLAPGHEGRYWIEFQWEASSLVFMPIDYGREATGGVNIGFMTCPSVLLNFTPTLVNVCDIVEVQSEGLVDSAGNGCEIQIRLRNKTSSFLTIGFFYKFFTPDGNELAPGGIAGTMNGGETKTLAGIARNIGDGPCSKIGSFRADPGRSVITRN